MNIEQITGINNISADVAIGSGELTSSANEKSFSDWLGAEVSNLNDLAINAEMAVDQAIKGDVDNLHQVIMGLEKSKQSFQLAVQIRDRVLEGYQEILRMQVSFNAH